MDNFSSTLCRPAFPIGPTQFLEQLLVRRGHRVRLATNGREALAGTGEEVFDMVILDVHMPEPNGFQVVRAIRSESAPWRVA